MLPSVLSHPANQTTQQPTSSSSLLLLLLLLLLHATVHGSSDPIHATLAGAQKPAPQLPGHPNTQPFIQATRCCLIFSNYEALGMQTVTHSRPETSAATGPCLSFAPSVSAYLPAPTAMAGAATRR